MALPSFLKDRDEKNKKGKKAKEKGDFRAKCLALLEQIKTINEDKYNELSKEFHKGYSSVNVQRNKLLGFYAHLKDELQRLKFDLGGEAQKVLKTVEVKAHEMAKKTSGTTKKVASAVAKSASDAGKAVKKATKKVAAKPEKKTEKKVEKKVAKKVAKKTEKKVAKKVAKKVEKKVAKKAPVKKKAPAKKKTSKK